VHWGCDYATSLDIEVDPQRRRFGRRGSDFDLLRLVEGRAFVPERVRLVALRWHASGSEVRLSLPVGMSSDDDAFYLSLQKQKIGAKLHIYL
jgi:hypothetical protein